MTVTLKVLEATIAQIVNSAKYISMNIKNRGKSLITNGYRSIPETEKSIYPFLKGMGGVLGHRHLYPSLGYQDLATDTPQKKDCYFLNLIGVQYIHNLVSKSLTVKKRMLIKNRVSYKF